MPLVLGIDSSTQSTKAELRDADDGRVVGSGHAPHPPTHPPRSEQDPAAWWQALLDARDQTGSVAPHAVAVAAQQHGLVALDDQSQVIRPAKLWNDTESAADAEWLIEQLGGREVWAGLCGTVPVAALTVTKLSWLHRKEPENFARMARVVLPHDWLTGRIAGRYATDRGDASGTGYWSPREGRYLPEVLAVVDAERDWSGCFPKVLGPLEPAGERENVTIGPGTGDNMAAALGVALRPGDVAVSLGTSGVISTVSEEPTADPTGAVAGFADATGRFLPLVCTLNATKVTDAIAGLLHVDPAGLDQLALRAPPGAGGVVLVPYFDGERTPNRPDATGTLTGLRSDVTAEHVARAAFEGVVCGLLDGLDALRAAGASVDGRMVLVGGGARSHAYQRVLADLTGRAVEVPRGEQVAAGACVQAAAVLHQRPPEEVASEWALDAARAVEPDLRVDAEAVRARYAAARGEDAPEGEAG
ncbi:MAG: xylulokinase [Actinomycetota bacterium]